MIVFKLNFENTISVFQMPFLEKRSSTRSGVSSPHIIYTLHKRYYLPRDGELCRPILSSISFSLRSWLIYPFAFYFELETLTDNRVLHPILLLLQESRCIKQRHCDVHESMWLCWRGYYANQTTMHLWHDIMLCVMPQQLCYTDLSIFSIDCY